jgi:hypothetical protein
MLTISGGSYTINKRVLMTYWRYHSLLDIFSVDRMMNMR